MGIWDKEFHNEEAMESMFKGTGLTNLDLDQDPQSDLNNQMGTFYETDIHKAYASSQGKDDDTVTIANISRPDQKEN